MDRETDQQNTSKQPYRVNPVSFTNMIIITIIGIINREKLNYTCTHTHGPKIVGVRSYPRRLVNLGLGLRSQRLHLFDSARLEIVLNFCTTF